VIVTFVRVTAFTISRPAPRPPPPPTPPYCRPKYSPFEFGPGMPAPPPFPPAPVVLSLTVDRLIVRVPRLYTPPPPRDTVFGKPLLGL
jgi:hypothetical protein